MTSEILPRLDKQFVEKYKNTKEGTKAYDFIFVIINHYLSYLSKHKNPELAINDFNDDQHTLLAFNYLYIQVGNSGFLGLIQNGYGLYIFETPFEQNIKKFETLELSRLIHEAKSIYEECKAYMQAHSEEEFNEKYDYFSKQFSPLDARFYDISDEQTCKIKDYIIKNISNFAIVR